jgi:hypothetical protein
MRLAIVAAVAMAMPVPAFVALAQTRLPTTIVVAPKSRPKPAVVTRVAPSQSTVDSAGLPIHPDPETPHVRARDWNAPGVMNLNYMTEAQFVAFQAAHPTAVFYGRCFAGQDPDPNIRAFFRRRVPFGCGG